MHLLAGWLAVALKGLLEWFAKYFGKRLAVTLAVVTAFSALTLTMWGTIQGLLGGIAVTVPPQINIVASWIVPSNMVECFTAIFSAKFVRFVYETKVRALDFQARV